MEVCMYRALTDVGVANEKAEAVVNAVDEDIDMRVKNAVDMGMTAVRADIAAFAGTMKADIAALSGELKATAAGLNAHIERLDDKIASIRWFVTTTVAVTVVFVGAAGVIAQLVR